MLSYQENYLAIMGYLREAEEELRKLAIQAKAEVDQGKKQTKDINNFFKYLDYFLSTFIAPTVRNSHISSDLLQEAKQRTMIEIFDKISEYNSDMRLSSWLYSIFRYRVLDQLRGDKRNAEHSMISLNQPIFSSTKTELLDCIADDSYIHTEEEYSIQKLIDFIKEDPDSILKSISLKGYGNITLHSLILLRLEGKKWKEIASSSGCPIGTLSAFYNRHMKKITKRIKQSYQIGE